MPKHFSTLLVSEAKTLKLQDMTQFTEIYANYFKKLKTTKLLRLWSHNGRKCSFKFMYNGHLLRLKVINLYQLHFAAFNDLFELMFRKKD